MEMETEQNSTNIIFMDDFTMNHLMENFPVNFYEFWELHFNFHNVCVPRV